MDIGKRERRSAVRVPLGCEAIIKPAAPHPPRRGVCTDLSVDGMTLHTAYVPRPGELLEVVVQPASNAPGSAPPMHAKVQVRRCHAIVGSALFEVGVKIIEVLS